MMLRLRCLLKGHHHWTRDVDNQRCGICGTLPANRRPDDNTLMASWILGASGLVCAFLVLVSIWEMSDPCSEWKLFSENGLFVVVVIGGITTSITWVLVGVHVNQ